MEESLDIFFVMKGAIGAGFEINKIRKFGMKFIDCAIVGSFNCTFYQRSNYIWKCLTQAEGYFMYKADWLTLLDQHPEEIAKSMKQNILVDYIIKIRGRLENAKTKAFKKIVDRNLHQKVCVVESK